MPCRVSFVSVCAATLLAAAAPPAAAQVGYFGQNKVEYRNFTFQVMKTEHFDVYSYPEEEEAARMAGRMATDHPDRHGPKTCSATDHTDAHGPKTYLATDHTDRGGPRTLLSHGSHGRTRTETLLGHGSHGQTRTENLLGHGSHGQTRTENPPATDHTDRHGPRALRPRITRTDTDRKPTRPRITRTDTDRVGPDWR